jgi:DNA-binding beta-propeller fold protein YncE
MEKILRRKRMKKRQAILLALFVVFALKAQSAGTVPLRLVGKYQFPSDVKGYFDHLTVDIRGRRLFTTLPDHKSVDVFDMRTRKQIHSIGELGRPHALLYRGDLNRLYVTDGKPGELKIFDAKRYKLIKSVKLLVDADSISYDPATKYLYVVNGGGEAKMTYSMISMVDTTSGEKVGDIKVDGDTLEAMVLEASSPKMYLDNEAKNRVDVIDRNARTVIESWPIPLGKDAVSGRDVVSIALDEANHRLFVGCSSGHIVVFDTQTGKELQALPINKGIDDLAFDPASKRLYAPCGGGDGSVDVYEQTDPDHYKSLGQVPSGPGARNGRLLSELKRYFVEIPQHGTANAEVLEYEVQ